MTDLSDNQLLRAYADQKTEAAFAVLLRRHLDFVYSAALRMVRDSHTAQDVTQGVFMALSQNAGALAAHPLLAGWLHRTTQNIAAQTVRTEIRRRLREQHAATMNDSSLENSDAVWEEVLPILDTALSELNSRDRDALLLRFFQRKTAREVGAALDIGEDAAQKCLTRALERLREILRRRGVSVGAPALGTAISANAIQSAPAEISASISATVAAIHASAHLPSIATATKVIAMTAFQKTTVALIVAAALGAAIYEAREASRIRGDLERLAAQQLQTDAMRRELDDATNRVAMLAGELSRVKFNSNELMRLRRDVARVRDQSADADPAIMKLAVKVASLKRKAVESPKLTLPEMRFLTDKDWADVAAGADMATEDGIREAFSNLREKAIDTFLNEMMKDAMRRYLSVNNNVAPASLSDLTPFFNAPVTQDMLSNYQLLQTGEVDNSADLVTLTNHVDDVYDSNHGMSINGAHGGGYNRVGEAVRNAIVNFVIANGGQMPTDPSQIQPLLSQPLDSATVQKYITQAGANPAPPELMIVGPALQAFNAANNGAMPSTAADIMPFLTSPAQLSALEKLDGDAGALAPAFNAYSAANNGQIPRNIAELTPFLSTPNLQAAYRRFTGPIPH